MKRPDRAAVTRGAGRLLRQQSFVLLLALLAVFAAFYIGIRINEGRSAADGFVALRNLETILRHSSKIAVAALGMTLVIIMGGIDLSVGSVVAAAAVAAALPLSYEGADSLGFAFACGVGMGVAWGLFNGLLITGLGVQPFIITLGALGAARGVAKAMAGNTTVNPDKSVDIGWLGRLLEAPSGDWGWMVLAPGVWMMIAIGALIAAMLRYTRLGRHIVAIGSNERTAELCGVPVRRVKVIVYVMMGALAGLSGLLSFSDLQQGDPTTAIGLELNVIAAVVIGGGSLAGGQGSVLGTLLGAVVMETIDTGATFMGWPQFVKEIMTGLIIIAAVALDRLRHRRVQ